MRTTLDINDEILGAARRRAAEQGKSLTAVIEEALAALLAAKPKQAKKFKLALPVHRGGKLRAGVDLDDRDSLYDIMEDRR